MNQHIKDLKLLTNKKGFLVRDLGIALVFAMTVIALFVIFAQGMAANYNRSDLVDPNFANHYNQLSGLTNTVEQSHSSVTGSSGLSFLGQFDVVFNSFFSVIGIGWDSYNIIFGGISNIISDFTFLDPGVVYILLTSLITALLIFLIFTIISSVTRGRI